MKTKHSIIWVSTVLGLVVLLSLFAPIISPADPIETAVTLRNAPPSAEHLFGTDNLGRDVLSRVIHGGRAALLISFSATLLSMVVGIFFGSLAGWFGRVLDSAIQTLMSVFQGLPGISIIIAVVGVLGPSDLSIFLALSLTSWSGVSRVVRSQIRELRSQQFVDTARLYLPGSGYIVVRHLLPLVMPTLVVLGMHRLGRMILTIAALSFIGVGLQPPTPDWGVMIQDSRQYLMQQPWSLVAPAIMLFVAAFSVARLGELLRDHWDVHRNDTLAVG